jgi:hypothetical protein
VKKGFKMKKEYDFSKGIRGKFFRDDMKLNVPIYLDDDNQEFINRIAKKKKSSSTIVW